MVVVVMITIFKCDGVNEADGGCGGLMMNVTLNWRGCSNYERQ